MSADPEQPVTTRTFPALIAVAAAAALALTGCTADRPHSGEGPAVETARTETLPTAAATTTAPAPKATSVSLPSRWALVGSGPRVIVISDYGDDGAMATYHLYGPGTSTGGRIVIKDQWDQSRVEGQWTAVQRDASSGIALALVSLEKTPNDGLNAGGRELVIRTFDVNGTKIEQQKIAVQDQFDADGVQELGLLGNTLVVQDGGITRPTNGHDTVAEAINVTTGALLWTVPCGTGYAGTTPMYAGANTVAVACDYNGVLGLNLRSGETVWQYVGGDTQSFDYDASAPGVLSAAEFSGSADVTINLLSGTKIADQGKAPVLGDPNTGLQAIGKLDVYNPATASTVLSISQSAIDQLGNFMPISAFDGRLTFMASDGLNVVSLTTGKADPSSPAKSAQKQSYKTVVADAGTGWALLGSISANWNPESWVSSAPVTPYAIMWAPAQGGTLAWVDIAGPTIG